METSLIVSLRSIYCWAHLCTQILNLFIQWVEGKTEEGEKQPHMKLGQTRTRTQTARAGRPVSLPSPPVFHLNCFRREDTLFRQVLSYRPELKKELRGRPNTKQYMLLWDWGMYTLTWGWRSQCYLWQKIFKIFSKGPGSYIVALSRWLLSDLNEMLVDLKPCAGPI